ncbi:MAG TPA: condensation domain-containing protein [Streptosporangiaceae bacterium]|nr:condensation domain-containing protein [Streptosporangiaceae bacterium]
MPDHPATAVTSTVRTAAELLQARAADQPDRPGYTFLADGETDEHELTYAEADLRARIIAAGIRDAGGMPGARVILVLPPGLDYITAFFGCLYAGVVAVPVYPPDPAQLERTLPRLLAIVRDATPVVALTISPFLGFLDELTGRAPGVGALRWLAVDATPAAAPLADLIPVDPEATAVLQYTSGSTSAPRGVMLCHRNLLHNSRLIQDFFRTAPDTRAMSWLPPYHDMGLIGGLLQPLYAGCRVWLMSPLHFLEQPMRWLQAIHRLRITASGGPNFAYDLCVRRSDPELAARLNLSSWRVAFNGAEPIRPETLRRFASFFAASGFDARAWLPCYGLAEATLIVAGTGGLPGSGNRDSAAPALVRVDRAALERHLALPGADGPSVDLTSCGHGAADQRIVIVDPATLMARTAGQVGEILVSGPSVAVGYWGKPEESDRVFGARVADRDEGPLLRTGDLGFLHDGQLVITGRLKDLIIVRGQNHYPHDIELTAQQADPVLRPGGTAAFQVAADDGEDRLVLVHEVRRQTGELDVRQVTTRIRQAVAREHGLQVPTIVLVPAGGMPKTSSGKVQRWLCRARFLSAELPEIGRGDTTVGTPPPGTLATAEQVISAPESRAALLESYLRGMLAAVAGQDPGEFASRRPLLATGLDSLTVIQLKHRVDTDLGVSLPLAAVLGGATLYDVADELRLQLDEPTPGRALVASPAGPATRAGGPQTTELAAPMSYNQSRMWAIQQFEPASTVYTIAVALRLLDPVDYHALRLALDALVSRHPTLRTTFPIRDGQPVQLIAPSGRAAYQEHDARDLDQAALVQCLASAARRPFDLERGPLLRTDVYRHPGGDVLLLSVHHIITDFWSTTILARELGAYYGGYADGQDTALPEPTATFVDVVAWQRSVVHDDASASRLARYWDEQVGAGVPALALPAPGPSARGGSRRFSLSATLTRRLHKQAAAENVTLYVLLVTTFQAVLLRLTGQHDLVIGTDVAGRTHPGFADVVGCCTNPVMIRARADGCESFRALLSRTREQVLGALEHQDYPMALLAERHKTANSGRTLFETLFAFNRPPEPGDDLAALATSGPPGARCRLGPLQVESLPLPLDESAIPLELVMTEASGAAHGVLRYAAGALDEPAADRLVQQFVAMLEMVAADPGTAISELTAGA